MSGALRRLADWLERPPVSAGRLHCSELAPLLQRPRDVVYLAIGPVALFVDLPRSVERPPAPVRRVSLDGIGMRDAP